MPVGLRKTNSRQTLVQTAVRCSSQSKSKAPRPRRDDRSSYLWAALCAVFLFLFFHLALFRRVSDGVLMRCSQTPSAPIQSENLAALQQLKAQKAWLQADVDRELGSQTCQHVLPHSTHLTSPHAMTQPLILFIGVVSDRASSRQLARQSWFGQANSQQGCQAKFVVEEDKATSALSELHADDTLYVQSKSSVRRTLFLMQYALVHFDVQYIMKTSDDVYINVRNLVQTLQANCTDTQCNHEHVYFGHEIKNTSVPLTNGGNKPETNLQYFKTTHLKTFIPYMSGIGYAVSSDLAHVLIDTEHKTKSNDFLTELNDADMTIGFWLITLDTHRIDHSGVISCSEGGCFQSDALSIPVAASTSHVSSTLRPALGQPVSVWNRHAIPKPIADVCSTDWLLMHPICHQHEVEFIQQRLQQCKAANRIQQTMATTAAKDKAVCHMHLSHGKVHGISGSTQQQQYLLGSVSANPWNAAGSTLLALEPRPSKNKLGLGLLKASNTSTDDTWYWEHLDTSSAWNTQQGPELQWLGAATDRYIVFNDESCQGVQLISNAYCTIIFDMQRLTRLRALPLPIAALSAGGEHGLHISFERQNHAMPGLGYTVTANKLGTLAESAPSKDGLWLMDMFTGKAHLILSLHQLAKLQSDSIAMTHTLQAGSPSQSCYHWLSKPKFNTEATSIAFLHHISNCTQRQSSAAVPSADTATATVELVTVSLDGSRIWALPLDDVKSFDYGRWGRLLVSTSQGLYEAEVPRHSMQKLKPPATVAWASLSHCSYHQQTERHILAVTNSWPQKEVAIWDRWNDNLHTVGLYRARREGSPFVHQGLHPMWSPDGCSLAFDSTHTGQGWQVFIAGVSGLGVHPVMATPSGLPGQTVPAPQLKRHIFVDLGSGTGAEIGSYLAANPAQRSSIHVHAFEPSRVHLQHLKAALARHNLQPHVTVHEAAAWVADEQVTLHKVSDRGSSQIEKPSEASHGLMSSMISSLVYSVAGKLSLLNARMSMFGDSDAVAEAQSVQAVDFSKWLLQNTRPQDFVVVKMDIAGAEFDVLERMGVDGSIMLVDVMDITWHEDLRPELRDWVLMYEQILQRLNIQSGFGQQDLQQM